jgi:hypothetical protein
MNYGMAHEADSGKSDYESRNEIKAQGGSKSLLVFRKNLLPELQSWQETQIKFAHPYFSWVFRPLVDLEKLGQ